MLDGVVAIPIKEWNPKLEILQQREDDDLTNYNIKGVNELRQILFSNISVTKLANPAIRLAALICKRKFLHELLRRNLPHRAVRQNTIWLYAGSGLDLYSLLFLGAENIVLIDPMFAKKSASSRIKSLAGKVILRDSNQRKVEPKVFQIDNDRISFELDLGEGPTEINVRWIAQNFEDYQPQKKNESA